MAVYDILPTENLKWDDIRDTLNANGGVVSNVAETAFHSSANVNKWSKCKPVRLKQDFTDHSSNWYKANDGNCGFGGLSLYDSNTIMTAYKNGDTWEYLLPRGGADEPFRLGDFREYYTKAIPFIRTGLKKDNSYKANTAGTGLVAFEFDATPEEHSIQLKDFDNSTFYPLANAKIAAFICYGNPLSSDISAQVKSIQYGDVISSKNKPTITLDFNKIQLGSYYVVFAMSYEAQNISYMTIPDPTEDNYIMVVVTNENDPLFGTKAVFSRIGFEANGIEANTPLTNIEYFANAYSPYFQSLKLFERGQLSLEFDINTLKAEQDYTIPNADNFIVRLRRVLGDDGGYINNMKVVKINDSSPSFPYVCKKGTNTKVLLQNNFGDAVIGSDIQDGWNNLSLYDKRYQYDSAIDNLDISVDIPPYK